MVKAGPYWKQEGFFTGNVTEDGIVKKYVAELLLQSRYTPVLYSGEASPTFGHANANFSVFLHRVRNQFLKK